MTTGQQEAVDQRLDQHTAAMEVVLDKLDEISAKQDTNARTLRLLTDRVLYLEAIVLPDDHPRRS